MNAFERNSGARPPVTVVIATRDRPAFLAQSLAALSLAVSDEDQIIVVDSASRSDRVRSVAEGAGAMAIRCEQPGVCKARNLGWRAATTDIVAFTDDDCLPSPEWIWALSKAFLQAPEVAFVTGRVASDDVVRGRAELSLSLSSSDQPARFRLGNDLHEMGHGANMAWRRSILEVIGGFDEGMGPGTGFRAAEDQDSFWRALRRGYSGQFEPEAVVIHRHWRNRRQQLKTTYAYGLGSGAFAVKRRRVEGSGISRASRPSALSVWSLLWTVDLPAARTFGQRVKDLIRIRYEMGVVGEMGFFAGFVSGSMKARGAPLSNVYWTYSPDAIG